MVKLGLRTARPTNFPHLHNFSLESERISSYSHCWRAGARENSEREICAGSHRIHSNVKRDRKRFHGSHRTHQPKKNSLLKQENQDLLSNGSQYYATDQGGVKLVKPRRRMRASSCYRVYARQSEHRIHQDGDFRRRLGCTRHHLDQNGVDMRNRKTLF